MTPVYNGYDEQFLTGKELKEKYSLAFYCGGRHHATVYDLLIPEYLDSLGIVDSTDYRIFYNDCFCRVMLKSNDKLIDFFAHKTFDDLDYYNRHLAEEITCPLCGGSMVSKIGRFGPFLSCKNYPQCKGSKKIMILGEDSSFNGFKPSFFGKGV